MLGNLGSKEVRAPRVVDLSQDSGESRTGQHLRRGSKVGILLNENQHLESHYILTRVIPLCQMLNKSINLLRFLPCFLQQLCYMNDTWW